MGKVVSTTYVCDGCGKKSDHSDFNDGLTCGSSKVQIAWSKGGRGFDGAWGGSSGEGEYLLCAKCGDAVRDLIHTLAQGEKQG